MLARLLRSALASYLPFYSHPRELLLECSLPRIRNVLE